MPPKGGQGPYKAPATSASSPSAEAVSPGARESSRQLLVPLPVLVAGGLPSLPLSQTALKGCWLQAPVGTAGPQVGAGVP